MNVAIVNNGSGYPQRIVDLLLGQILDTTVDIVVFDWSETSSINLNNTDLLLLSGSNQMPIAFNKEKLSQEIELILRSGIPTIGICYGCELMAVAFGGGLKDCGPDNVHRDLVEMKVVAESDVFQEKDSFKAYDAHRWVIDPVPESFSVLAESSHGPEIIKHNERPMYGFQFHLEKMLEQSYGDELFLAVLKKCDLLA